MASAIDQLRSEALQRKLNALRTQTVGGVREGLQRAAEVIVAEQRRLAPKKTGKLRDSIQATSGKAAAYSVFRSAGFKASTNEKVTIAAGNSDVRYAHLVEFGAAPHKIKPKAGKVLKTGEDAFAAGVDHPGATAQPFFFPGYRATRRKAQSIIGKAVRDSVKKAVK